ncbi:aromatase/cyclase [Streptomyces sp. ST2-7A]|uniref:aromatase/cyclase n=1 Tax=Streptomyces sp. ST2-7A TaxID=2907214 RepID=UPI001F439E89|nr:aromatase/cyclase [Streptomyces sp. ST2-7A]MCE7083346.1 aromatase/cyclase [Streptomyces sp. ST2-7A]
MIREVEHEITVHAAARDVYRLIADVERWPQLFPPTVYVDHVERSESEERIRIWATANGEPKSWTSRRALAPEQLTITFRQEASAPPVASMGGTWIIEPRGARLCRVRLLHDYRAVDDDPAGLEWITRAVDRNSRSELAALKSNIELATGAAELMLSFEDAVRIDGPAKDIYRFLDEADQWEARLPHVAAVRLREYAPGLQSLRMETLTKDGGRHTTESIRVCFPDHKIVYKQTTLPALMQLHTGCWSLTEHGDGSTTATSQHTVVINAKAIATVLGAAAGVAEAGAFLRDALGGNSRATLALAEEHVARKKR